MTRALLPLALLLALAPLARGEDTDKDWKWDPQSQPKAKAVVGERWFWDVDEGTKQKISADQKVVQDQARKTVYSFKGETLKVENDKAVENRFTIEKWSISSGKGEPDTCLEGKTILVTNIGPETSWECTEKDAKLSPEAKAWIGAKLAKKTKPGQDDDDQGKKAFFPEKPIGDGEEWTRDPAAVAKLVLGDKLEIEGDKSSFKGKLTNVRVEDGVHVGHLELKLSLKVKANAQFSEGGTLVLDFVVDGSLEENKSQAASEKITLVYTLVNHKKADKGAAVVITVNTENEGTKKHGPVKDKEKEEEKK